MARKTDRQNAEKVQKIALDMGIVAFEPHQVPRDPEKARKVLAARAKLANEHFQQALEAGII
ncbi:MAG TPA: hypothetical protein VJH63_02895 [Candidatus Paceibacterota bacterium]